MPPEPRPLLHRRPPFDKLRGTALCKKKQRWASSPIIAPAKVAQPPPTYFALCSPSENAKFGLFGEVFCMGCEALERLEEDWKHARSEYSYFTCAENKTLRQISDRNLSHT